MNSIDCHVCGRATSITPRGRLRSHKRWAALQNRWATCQGSGLGPGQAPIPVAPDPAAPATVAYRCKVSPGRVIELVLPVDLSADEMRRLCAFLMTQADEPAADPPYVCPSCHAMAPDRCVPGCLDAEIEAEHRHAIESGEYDRQTDDEPEEPAPQTHDVKPVTGPWPAGPWPSDDEERARQRGGA